jgi:hypothetical protein
MCGKLFHSVHHQEKFEIGIQISMKDCTFQGPFERRPPRQDHNCEDLNSGRLRFDSSHKKLDCVK